jgi:hypothetical protein
MATTSADEVDMESKMGDIIWGTKTTSSYSIRVDVWSGTRTTFGKEMDWIEREYSIRYKLHISLRKEYSIRYETGIWLHELHTRINSWRLRFIIKEHKYSGNLGLYTPHWSSCAFARFLLGLEESIWFGCTFEAASRRPQKQSPPELRAMTTVEVLKSMA